MIRRRGLSLLAAALVFIAIAALTISRLSGTSASVIRGDGVVLKGAGAARTTGKPTATGGAQEVLDVGGVKDGGPAGDVDTLLDLEGTLSLDDTNDNSEETERPESNPAQEAEATKPAVTNTTGNTPSDDEVLPPSTPTPPTESLDVHPIAHLVQKASDDAAALLARQSTTLAQAVVEYRRRYGLSPPPHFDKWFAFAASRNVSLVDEFDSVHDMLGPFWGLGPRTIRRRAAEALGYGNAVMGMLVRGGEVALQTGGKPWEREAVAEMTAGFREWLPDLDLVFNALDEPRVVLQHGDLSRLVERGAEARARAGANAASAGGGGGVVNGFTQRAEEMGDGSKVAEVSNSRFVAASRQSAWAIARMSCPPDSPARALDPSSTDSESDDDDTTGYCAPDHHPLCFITNTTAQTDICSTPSLARTHGFFDRPNSLSVSHDLIPVFSASKLSSFQDILFPAPWYWASRVPYDPSADPPWADKDPQLYWRGSTTGGFSRWGGWRGHHRQRAVQRLNDASQAATVLLRPASSGEGGEEEEEEEEDSPRPRWTPETSSVAAHAHLLNVSFTHVGQCDPGDCAAQRKALPMSAPMPQKAAWRHRLLLDVDGNAFSGRFQAFLRSGSAVLKMAVFREWSSSGAVGGWVVPWRDYVPLSLGGGEWVEAVRYLSEEEEGREIAERLGRGGGEGLGKGMVRREDMEVWFFRLLLEYARVVDDDREKIGFTLHEEEPPSP